MKKILSLAFVMLLVLALVMTGCAKLEAPPAEEKPAEAPPAEEKPAEAPPAEEEPLKIVLLINGTLGDKSFFDSAENGMKLIRQEFGDKVQTRTIEMTHDQTKWKPTLLDVSEQDWDIIIVGTWQMVDYLTAIAPKFPDNKYIIFDSSVDYSKGLPNVHSILFKQNEGAFLAGALAAKVTSSDLPLANKENTIGFLGGMDIPVINDFLVGYIQGAKYVDPDVKVAISYIGSFADAAKGKEMALAQYNQGVDIGFNVAGQAGLGQFEAAKAANRYAIGVDSDQAMLFKDHDPAKANLIMTSVLKRVDVALLRAVKLHMDGKLPYGAAESLGIKEEAIGLADNEFFQKLVPADIREELSSISERIVSGEIKVDTALGMTTETLNALRDSVRP